MAGPKTSSAAKHASATTGGTPKTAPATPSARKSASTTALQTLWSAYTDATPSRLKFVDAFLVFLVLSGVIQFVYCVLVTSFPFNAFLAGCAAGLFLSYAAPRRAETVCLFFLWWGQVREQCGTIRAHCFVALASQRVKPGSIQRSVTRKVSDP